MADYNFQTLNDREFEQLSRDLLQKELQLTLESFKPGRDGGIDLRYISSKDQTDIVVQAKHWSRSKFSDLFSYLKKEELPKVKKIAPRRYILTTSVEFNPDEKDKIQKLFKPYISTPADILGKDDLNGLLTKYPDVEEAHHKLWLSSINVLKKIINNGIKGRSEFVASNIERNISLYVPNKEYSKALEILNKERFLIIIGEPGIGKTVLAKILIYELLANDYKLVNINEKISEAEELWEAEQNQVFYFDDFLGANYLEILEHPNSDSALTNFIMRIAADPTKRLILTSRTTVLNQAAQKHSSLREPSLKLAKHEVRLGDYSKWDRALILYNHLYFLDLGLEYQQKIKENKNYWKIINHKNYNPRLIEFITNPKRLEEVKPQNYIKFIVKNLDRPTEIWKDAYLYQIDDYSRFLLQTLFSLGPSKGEVLKKAFNARLDYEILHNGFKRGTDVYTTCIQQLLGGFIKSERISSSENVFDFFNPSLTDFLLEFISTNAEDKWRILDSAIYTSQFNVRFNKKQQGGIRFSKEELKRLYEILKSKSGSLEECANGSTELELLDFYVHTFNFGKKTKDYIVELIKTVDTSKILRRQNWLLLAQMEKFARFPRTNEAVISRWSVFIDHLFMNAEEKEEFDSIYDLFEEYRQDYDEYISDKKSEIIVGKSLENYWNSRIDKIKWENDELIEFSEHHEVTNYLESLYGNGNKMNSKFGVTLYPTMNKLLDIDVDSVIDSNAEKNSEDHGLDSYYDDRSDDDGREEIRKVDELFS